MRKNPLSDAPRRGSMAASVFGLAVLLAFSPARAQAPAIADIATYSGADRAERLIAGARTEGTLTLYSSARVDDTMALAALFERTYGVKVRLWRGGSEAILSRVVNESRSGRSETDVVETAGPEMTALTREKLLQQINSPILADLIPSAIMPHRAWVATRYSLFTAAYNTNLVAAADVPKRYEDLLDPKWRGRLALEADDANWFLSVVEAIGEQGGLDLFRNIVAKNGISIRKGHSLLANLVVSGEVPLALTVYGYRVAQLKKAGAPIDKVYLPPVIALPTGVGVLRKAPHPFAAVLFADFMLSDGQAVMAQRDHVVTNRKVGGLPAGLNVAFVDLPKFLDERDKWTQLYKEIFVNQAH